MRLEQGETGGGPAALSPRARRSALYAHGFAVAVVLALAWAYRGVLELPHVGFDAYPFLASARAASLGDLARILGQEAMGGRYPAGDFYRPLATLSFTLDHALWGTDARGFHRTDVLILLASALALHGLARRLIGGLVGPGVALFAFAFHTAHLSTVPASARRVETLYLLFALLALLAVARPRPRAAASFMAASCALLAVASKETGALVPAWVGALVLARWPGKDGRLTGAVRSALPAALAVAIFFVARQLVLHGFGGHVETALEGLFSFPRALWDYARGLIVAQPPGRGLAPGPRWTLAGGVLILCSAAPLAVRKPQRGADLRLLGFLLFWLASLACSSAISGRVFPWHIASGLPVYALGLGLLARRAADAWRAGRAVRLAALPAGAALALLLALDLRVSPLVHTYDEWPLMGRLTRTALSSAASAAAELEPGQSRDLGFIPGILPRRTLGPGIEAVGLEDYTLQAFLEVEHPDVDVLVVPLPEDAELLTIPGKRLLGVRLATIGRAPREE